MKKIYKIMTLLCCLSVLAMSNVVSAQCAPLAELIIDITADQYPDENTWSLTEDGVEIAFGGGESQNVTVCVDVLKCHEFTMADSYGDGQFGSAFFGVDGTTTITLDGTEVFSSTGDWGGSISGNFGGCTSGCGDITANNYDATADIIDNSLCTYDVAQGCTVVSACNYDAAAVVDDGSCTYADAGFDCNGDCLIGVAVVYAPGGFSEENSFTINDCDGNVLASMAAGTASFNSCVNLPAIYTVILTDSYGDTWNGGTLTVDGVVYDQPTTAGVPTATSDSYQVGGACPVYGCTDPTAANYDSLATVDATSSSDPTSTCTFGIAGCTEELACNYDSGATANDGSCVFAVGGFDCNGDCLAGVGLSIVITADEYSAENTWSLTEDGVEVAFGGGDDQNLSICVDPTLCYEFTMADSYGDGQFGSAFFGVDGTTTITLDGTEVFSSTGDWGGSISGNFGACVTDCGDITANNYNAAADIIDNTLCTYDVVQGCTDGLACNYDSLAVNDDGSCVFAVGGFDCNGDCLIGVAVVYAPGGFSEENSFTINDCDGNVLASMAAGTASFNSCVNLPAIYTVILTDSYGDTWNGGTLTVDGVVYDQPTTAGVPTATSDSYQVGGACPVYGCTDPTAANYDSLATVDATSSSDPTSPCTFGIPGCTEELACNYDSGATANDGSCVFAAEGLDCNGDCLAGSPVVITLTDSYGDTWNGGTLTVGGVVYDQPATAVPGSGGASDSYAVCLDLSGCLIAEYNTGGFSGEHSWSIADDAGVVLASGIGSTGAYDTTLGAACGVLGCNDATALNYDPAADSCDGLVGGTDTSCCEFPPANDDCSGAIAVACGDVVSGSSLNSTVGNEVLALECGTAITSPGVWYSFSSTGSEEVTFSTCNFGSAGAPLDTKINVFSGSCGDYACAGGNDDAGCPNFLSEVTIITPSAPTDYFIHVSGYATQTGAFDLTVTCDVASCTPPVNDVCSSAFAVPNALALIGNNVCAQGNDLVPACAGFGAVDGVWYTWNSDANNALSLVFGPAATPDVGDSAAVNPSIAIFSGNCANPTELGCYNGAATENVTGLTINTTYYFLVFTDADIDQGQYDLTLTGGLGGCSIQGACNYDASASVDDGSCDLSCIGCTDPLAINYDPLASFDDGSCVFCTDNVVTITAGGGTFDGEITWELLGSDGSGVPVASGLAETVTACLVDDCYTVNMFDSFGDGWNGATITLTDDQGNVLGSGTFADGAQGTFDIGIGFICPVIGCFDPLATNYDDTANTGDQLALCEYLGCINVAACNYNPLAITDDGTCCLTNCVTVSITDVAGNGGTTVTIFDDLGNTVASLVGSGSLITETFCIADACADVVVSVDGLPGQAGVNITGSTNGVLLDFGTGTITAGSTTTVTVGAAVGCVVSGCTDALALNYNAAANADCLDVFGGTNVTCCIYPVANNDCDGAIALLAGVETAWDSNNTDDSGNNCSPTLTNDVWYSYTPACDLEVTVTSASNQGGQVAIWEGDCAALTLVECGPNEGLIGTTITAILTGGTTYSIQVGSNSDFGAVSTGTIILEEGLCRGCTYPDSPDYSAAAGVDDGSCTFDANTCPGDFSGDGFINVSDLGGFLGAFGTACD